MTRTATAAERRESVADFYSRGATIAEIAHAVSAPLGTVSCDVTLLRKTGDSRVPYRRENAAATAFGRRNKSSIELPVLKTPSLKEIRQSVRAYEMQLLAELDRIRHLRDVLDGDGTTKRSVA